jgi:tetratricopeptide (TPR) repeat protein
VTLQAGGGELDERHGDDALTLPPLLAAHVGAFAGRSEALATLDSCWRRVRNGGSDLVVVTGAAGTGKTWLACELARRAAVAGGLVLAARCEEGELTPYQPWIEALTDEAPELLSRTRVSGRVAEESVVVDSVTEALQRLAPRRSTLLVLDDLQWSDAPSVRLLRQVLRRSAGLLVIVTCRSDLSPVLRSALTDIRRDRVVERVDLSPFTVADIAELVEAEGVHLAVGSSPFTLAERIHRRSGGHPLLTSELVRHLRAGGDAEVLPSGIRDAVVARAGRLPVAAQDVLRRLAVLSRRFDLGVACQVVDRPEDEVRQAIDDGLSEGLLVEDGPIGLAFAHGLVRDALQSELPTLERRRLHARAMAALAAVDAPSAVLAVHARASGADAAAAARYSLSAASDAAAASSLEDAIDHLDAARGLLAETGDQGLLGSVLVELGDLAYSSGVRYVDGIRWLEQAVTLYERLGDERASAKARSRIGRALSTYFDTMDLPRAVEEFQNSARTLRRTGDDRALALTLVGLANALGWSWKITAALSAAEEAELLAARAGGSRAVAAAQATRARLLCHQGRLADGSVLFERAWRAAADEQLVDVAYYVTVFAASVARRHLDLDLADRVLRRGLSFPSLERAPWQREQLHLLLASVEIARGDLVGAQQRLPHIGVNRSTVDDYELALALGEQARALAVLDRFARPDRPLRHPFPVPFPLLLEEQPALVVQLEREVAASGEDLLGQITTRAALALALARTGDVDAAAEHVERARGLLTRDEEWGALPATLDLAEASVGAARGEGDRDRTIALAEAARSAFAARGALWMEAEALLVAARAAQAGGQVDAASASVDAAATLYRRAGAGAAWEQRAHALLAPAPRAEVAATRPAGGMVGVFRRTGEFWSVGLDGTSAAVRDSKGMRLLAVLVANPGREVTARDLEALTSDVVATEATPVIAADAGDAGPMLDEQAKNAYRCRLEALDAELEDADSSGDAARSRAVHAERTALLGELRRATGLAGRARRAGSGDERARLNVTRALRSAVRRIHESAPNVALHLDDALVTGSRCAYRPAVPVDWQH